MIYILLKKSYRVGRVKVKDDLNVCLFGLVWKRQTDCCLCSSFPKREKSVPQRQHLLLTLSSDRMHAHTHTHTAQSTHTRLKEYVEREMSSSWRQGEGDWSVLPSKECACEGGGRGGGGGEVLGLQRRECRRVQEGVWGAYHSFAQAQ